VVFHGPDGHGFAADGGGFPVRQRGAFDGRHHARIDGLTSLGVLFSALGVWLGYPLTDPVIGLLITLAILKAEVNLALAPELSLADAHKISKTARHEILNSKPLNTLIPLLHNHRQRIIFLMSV
jgi:divalent metal cation (Fe/Co/Zn/Cd) transporter